MSPFDWLRARLLQHQVEQQLLEQAASRKGRWSCVPSSGHWRWKYAGVEWTFPTFDVAYAMASREVRR